MGTRWLRWSIVGVGVIILLAQLVVALTNPGGDFILHWGWGLRLRTGLFLYEGGHAPYPPAWAVPHAPLSLLPLNIAKATFLLIGIASLGLLLWLLNRMTRDRLPLIEGSLFWVATATLLITLRFVHRDFDDGGQNIVLLTLAWLALWLFQQGRTWSAGASLGLAIALKCTAGLFVAYFLLKRQWKMAFTSTAWCALFFATPILFQGPSEFVRHMVHWRNNLKYGFSQTDPSYGLLGPEILQNKSLRPSLARYLIHLPPGHPGRHYIDQLPEGDPNRIAHPASLDFLDLSPQTANGIVKGILLLGLLGAGWLCRGALPKDDTQVLVWDGAILGVMTLLYSPIVWGQHYVAALPAFYLLVRSLAAQKIESRWLLAFLVGFALLLTLANRWLVGKDLSLLIESYHPVTFAMVGLVVVLFVVRDKVLAVATHVPEVEARRAA